MVKQVSRSATGSFSRGKLGGAIRLALSLATTGMVAPALAQAPTTSLDEVVVTGSRIRGVEAVGSAVIEVDRAQIEESGAANTSDLLRKIPQVLGLGASETAATAQNGAANVTRGVAVNLRGIGSNATLLLLDGRRFPPAGTQGQFTDASVIPSLAIERLEVVADGGSAIYGSDAITGVVNIIPRKDFVGAESVARYGAADAYDDWSIGQLFGTNWQSGHLMAAIDYSQHSSLNGQDRDFYTSNLAPFGGTDLRSQQCVPGTILVGTVPYAIPQNSTGTGLTPASFTPNTRNLCDNLKRGDIIPELERVSAMFSAEQSLNDSLTLFTEGYYSRRTFALQASQIVSNLTVPTTNPFYVHPTGGTGPITVQYDFANDGGLPNDPGHAESWEAIVGARQKLGADWQGEAYVAYGESEDFVDRHQNLNTTPGGINAALANPDPTQAFNPFGRGGISNPATVAAIRNGQFVISGDTGLTVAALQADGSLFTISGGAVRLATGAEYRKESLGGELRSGSTVAPTVVPSDISRNMYAVFAEAYVPLVGPDNAMSAAQRLDLSLAGRYEDYSDFGSTFNPKIGLSWRIVNGFTLHGSWGTSFRAPALAENDLRSSGYGLYGDTLPCNHLPPATTCSGIGIAGGNPDLKPEEANTWSAGIEFTPESLTGFKASVTYFNIDYDNQILALRGTSGLLTNPIYAPYRILSPTPAQVNVLLTSGLPINTPINPATVTYIQDGRRQNLGGTIAEGFDFALMNIWSLSAGEIRVGVNGTYFTTLTTAAAPGAAQVDVLNTINFPQKLRVRGELGWRREALSAVAFVNYTNAYDQTGVTPIRKIDAYTTVDLHFGYDFDASVNGLSIALDVQNVADTDPPFVNIAGGYDPQSASPIGRLIALSARFVW
jgi:iron complex outermembrane receptor protein